MSTNEKLKAEVLEAVRKAVPESMELKFGCRVIYERRKYTLIDKPMNMMSVQGVRATSETNRGHAFLHVESIDKIIGGDLGLQDVLIALDKSYPERYAYQATLGMILFMDKPKIPLNKRDYTRTALYYNLTKDFHHQSEEFYSFLHKILCQT